MAPQLRKTVVLVGMMGAGKSAVGKAMSEKLSVPFVDSDAEIERAAAQTIAEIFARDGEAFFRDREAQVIARLLDGQPCILSVGGGAYLRDETRARISELGVALWLRADLETLWGRVRRKDTRPLLRTPDPRQTLADLMATRDPVYALADLVLDSTPDLPVEGTAEHAIDALATRPDVLS